MKRFLSLALVCLLLLSALCLPAFAASGSPAAAKVTTGKANLNVRTGASTAKPVADKLPDGTLVTLLEQNGSWWKVRYDKAKTGYCHGDYLTVYPSSFHSTVSTGGGALNVRKAAGTDAAVLAQLQNGEAVAVLSQANGWSRILYHGSKAGYVASRYLAAKAVRFDVPYYSQTDARWKNVAIGTSGGTIGTIGCTTTCLAMTESFRTGKTVTPKAMAQTLRYMSGGALYWPADYETALANADVLGQIRDVLQSGRPVIFGSKKQSGTQHWCVVTGWNGKTLSDAAFTIQDPASASRTTLAQFRALYPAAYKLAWYK